MGENSSIEWTDHTFNPWHGCTKISPACTHCYAETFSKRVGHGKRLPTLWGPKAERKFFGDEHWRTPLRWDAEAARTGRRARVFCASMADVFEALPGELGRRLETTRRRLWDLIAATPHLDWLLLTKRPENVNGMSPWCGMPWPNHVWIGTTVEDQERADERIPHLQAVPARVRFLSCEPLLGPVRIAPWLSRQEPIHFVPFTPEARAAHGEEGPRVHVHKGIDWVIAGGESGPRARPMHPEWARSLRDQCVAAGVPFLFKQWGEWAPFHDETKYTRGGAETVRNAQKFINLDGSRGACWLYDDDGTLTNWCGDPRDGFVVVTRAGKTSAGRLLDHRTWDEFPEARP